MKKRLLTTAWLMLLAPVFAITMMAQTVTVQVNSAGGLSDALDAEVTDLTTVKNLTVTGKLGDADFKVIKIGLENLETLDISGTNIKEIPSQAFNNMANLKTVRLPEGITYIRYQAFENCQQLESVTFGTQTAVAGKIVFPSSLCYVEYNAFYYCQLLTHLDFSACNKLEYLGSSAFAYLYNLEEVLLPSQGNLRLEWSCFQTGETWDENTQQYIKKGLENMTLTKAVTELSGYCLPRTLKTLYVESSTPPSCYEDAFNEIKDDNIITVYVPKGSKSKYRFENGWSKIYQFMQEQGFQVNISGFGSLMQGNATYTDGDVFFAKGSTTTLKLVPDKDNEWISVKLDGNTINPANDGTFTIPAGTTVGTLDISFTSNMLTIDNPNGGELKDQIAALGLNPSTICAIKVTGKMASKDWAYVKNNMPVLQEFDLSETDLKAVPEQALQEHQALTVIHLPSTVTTISSSAFFNCPQLTTVEGCEHVKEIGSSAFSYCSKLANFPFGDELQTLDNCFCYCTSLPSKLGLPASVQSIGWAGSFDGSSIREFDLSQCHLTSSISQWMFGAAISVLLPEYGSYSVDLRTFENSNITELIFPSCVTYIGEYVVPSSVERIYARSVTPINADAKAFNYVDPNNCVLCVPIGSKDAYSEAQGWSLFTQIEEQGIKVNITGFGALMQGNITYTDGDALFATQGSATTLKLVPDKDNKWIEVKLDGNTIDPANDGTFTIPAGTTSGTLDISFTSNMLTIDNPNGGELKDKIAALGLNPSTIRAIKVTGKMAAKDWSYVKNNMPELQEFDLRETDVKTIPEQALQDHQKLTDIHLPSTVTIIGYSAFQNCQQLTTVDGYENVKEIGYSAFAYCSKLANFPFGDKIMSIEYNVFDNCISLPEKLEMSATLTTISSNVFYGSSVRNFDLSQCTFTGSLNYNPFGKCTSLLLPENGEYQLYWEAFKDAQLTELHLPAAVSSIYGNDILPTILERLYVSRATPIDANENPFRNIDLDDCTLYVPRGSVDAYASANSWSGFTKVKEYGMQVTVGEQGKLRTNGQTLMGTTTFFPKESTATFEIIPDAGWHTNKVTLDGAAIPFALNKFTLSGDQLNGILAVTFAINQFDLQLQITGDGKVKYGSTEYTTSQILTVDSLATLNLILEPAEGQMVSAITFNGQESVVQIQNGTTNYVTPAITAKSTLAITFGAGGAAGNAATYTVTTGEGGSVEYKSTTLLPQTSVLVPKGQDAVFAMKPNQYYIVNAVKLNGEDVTSELDADGKLTVKDVQADATLEVTFRMNAEITVVMEDAGTLTNMLSEKQKLIVTKLTIKGPIWENDFFTMRDEMPQLTEIDLWEAQTEYIPSQAFCTSTNWDATVGKKTLTSVRLPEMTKYIYSYAFAGCTNLKDVNFTALRNLEYMDSYTFESTNLQVIDLSNTKLTDVNEAFRNVKGLESIKFPATLTRLGSVFSQSTLTEIDLSNCTNLKTLDYTFSECKNLEKVTLPEGLTSISGAFNGCESLTAITLPKSIQVISNSAFSNTKIQKIDLTGLTDLQTIGSWAFAYCQELTEVLFPASLEQLGEYAFHNCSKLISIDLSETQLQSIPEWTFGSCWDLMSVKMPKTLKTIGNYAFNGDNKLGGILELGSAFTNMGEYAFSGTQIAIIRSEATVPPVLKANSMPEDWWVIAFVPKGCADAYDSAPVWEDRKILDKEVVAEVTVSKEGNLSIDINDQMGFSPAIVTHLKVHGPLGKQDFENMRYSMTVLYDLDISDAQVSVIPEKAFLDKKVLMHVKLPTSLRRIEQSAFQGCSSLTGMVELPDNLTFIGQSAFQGCSSLEEVVLNANLEVIQGYAFEGCSALAQEITLPSNFQSLGERAFANCSSLYGTVKFNRDFYMFMGAEGYGSSAGSCFENCSSIETVDMSEPDFLDEIPNSTFAGCTSLKTVLLPPTLNRIDNYAFAYCSSLDGIEFPNTLRVINWSAFQNCSSLTSINLSDCLDLGTIEGYAFNGCSTLETVYLPKNLNWIGERAFGNCRKLANLTVEALEPADLGEYVFEKVKTNRCVLSIPTGTFYDYLNAGQWGAFVSMRKNIDVTVGDGANLYVVNNDVAMARGARRAPAAEQQGTMVKDGSSVCVQENETAIFKVNTDENAKITKVLYNGEDVTNKMVNGTYVTPSVTDASKFEVQVEADLHVKELRMLDDDISMMVGEKRQLKFEIYPTYATNKDVEWTSSNKNVATVSSDGTIIGVAAGSVEITGKTIDGGIEAKRQIVITPNKYWIVMDEKVETEIENYLSMPLALHNEEEARSIQFDVWMLEGMDLYDWGIQLSERANGFPVSINRLSNKVVRVNISAPNGSKFKGSDGELLTLTFYTGGNGGVFDGGIRNIHITGPDNIDYTAPSHAIQFNVKDYPLGDSNGSGKVTISDAANNIAYMLGQGNERFIWSKADVNKDGNITIVDVTDIVDIVLERPSLARTRGGNNNAQGRIYMDDLSMTTGEQQTIGLQMENAADFIAFQCDIYLPEGMNVARDKNDKLMIGLSNGITSSHVISSSLLDDGVLRLVVMSPQNEDFSIPENNIVNLTVMADDTMTGDDVIDIRNIRLVRSSDHTEYVAPDASATVRFGTPTAFGKLLASKGLKMRTEGHYVIIEASEATVLQIVSTSGISRNLQIHAGENRFFIENAGVYIIDGNKLFIK